ncbi:AAA family ATPase (plasmid) [Halobacteriovorax sp. GFR7]|uniref:AAA family ATPase n=1 Tax=unclassified Halobacteriovorax TaxID=2639665 RepID=UPI003D99A41E
MTTDANRMFPSNGVVSEEKPLAKLIIGDSNSNSFGNKVVAFIGNPKDIAWKDIYETCVEKRSTVVVVLRNGEDFGLGYHAGVLNPPDNMVYDALLPFVDEILIPMTQKAVQGLTLTNIDAVLRLTKARDGEITPSGIRETRKAFVGDVRGLKLIESAQPYYVPDADLVEWLDTNKQPFRHAVIDRLTPRGVLLEGVAGTGKSAGAKYLAQELGVQLLHLGIGDMLSKWSGEAETNLEKALNTVEQMAPCVLLLDEVEKVIRSGEEDGASSRMLAKLLWWLQERKARILVVMTTNNIDALPQEMYRPPRIDENITLNGMPADEKEVAKFVQGLAEPFHKEGLILPDMGLVWQELTAKRYNVVDGIKVRTVKGKFLAQAEITGLYIKYIKKLNYS